MAVAADTDEFFDNDNVPAKEQLGEEKKDDDSESGFADFMNFMTNSDSGAKAPPPPTQSSSNNEIAESNTSSAEPTTTNNKPIDINDDSNNDNNGNDNTPLRKRSSCESIGDKVDESISGWFYGIGNFACNRSKTTIVLSLVIAIACAMGMAKLNTENRPEKVSRI